MTVVTGRATTPGPALTTARSADRVIAVLFAASIALFLLALVTL
jgi:hypothetical protein